MACNFQSSTRQKNFKLACIQFEVDKTIAIIKTSDLSPIDEKLSFHVGDTVDARWKVGKTFTQFDAKLLFLSSKFFIICYAYFLVRIALENKTEIGYHF